MNPGYIIAIDPGPTTGVCVMLYTGGREYLLIDSYLIAWDYRYTMINALFNYDPIAALIFEKFRLFPDKAQAQAYSEFETVQVSEILCTLAWTHDKYHLIVPLSPSVKGSPDPGKIGVKVRNEDADTVFKSASNQKDREHSTDAYQLARWYIMRELRNIRRG